MMFEFEIQERKPDGEWKTIAKAEDKTDAEMIVRWLNKSPLVTSARWQYRALLPRSNAGALAFYRYPDDENESGWEPQEGAPVSEEASGNVPVARTAGAASWGTEELAAIRAAVAEDVAEDEHSIRRVVGYCAKLVHRAVDDLTDALKESEARVWHPHTVAINQAAENLAKVDAALTSLKVKTIDELRAKLAAAEAKRNQWDAVAVKGLESIKDLEANLADARADVAQALADRRMIAEKLAEEKLGRETAEGVAEERRIRAKLAENRAEAAEARVKELESLRDSAIRFADWRLLVIK
jgi:hypothetical protein